MQNRRDHVQAHRHAVGRLVSALVAGDPGPLEVPMRRGHLGTQFGAVLAVLLAGGFVVFGLIDPVANTAWRQPGTVVVEQETGNRYVFNGKQLYPTVNYASALLAVGSSSKITDVSRSALVGVPRGPKIGIPGAPDDVPPASALLSGQYAVCVPQGSDSELVDLDPTGRTTPVPSNQYVLLSGPDQTKYVVWKGEKFPLKSQAELIALGLVAQQPIAVPTAWLAELPTGATLTAPHIPQAGSQGPSVAGHSAQVGDLFQTTAAGSRELYVLRSDGLAPINATEFALLTAVPGETTPQQVSAADVAAAPTSQDRSLLTGVPDILSGSPFSPGDSALCLSQAANSSTGGSVVTESLPTDSRTSGLLVPPGRAILVEAQSAQSAQSLGNTSQRFLITDNGTKYPLADDAAVTALGYSQAPVRTLPQQMLDLAPTGPTLDSTAAQAVVATPAAG